MSVQKPPIPDTWWSDMTAHLVAILIAGTLLFFAFKLYVDYKFEQWNNGLPPALRSTH